ncbi:hypothetical protein DL93DRAFT_2070392 [Clavulina sp. PMI_390]|nr:hypothetical protein DL93DRAFT_2070392 [Clavulina sp. PMI_390]
MKSTILAVVAASVGVTTAVGVYGQCGGEGWTGDTTCDGGLACVIHNQYYFQCLPYMSGESTAGSGYATTVAYGYYRR